MKMKDLDKCLICKRNIGKGNDPAICKSHNCKTAFYFEINFEKFAKEESKKIGKRD